MKTELDNWIGKNESRINDACGDSREADLWEDLMHYAFQRYCGVMEDIGNDTKRMKNQFRETMWQSMWSSLKCL